MRPRASSADSSSTVTSTGFAALGSTRFCRFSIVAPLLLLAGAAEHDGFRGHDLCAVNLEFANKRIDGLLQHLDLGRIGVVGLQLFGVARQHLGAASLKLPICTFKI